MNLDEKTFSYTVNQNGTVDYVANADGKKQNLSGLDLSSKETLEARLAEYTRAYVDGLALESPSIDASITVGQQQSVEV